MKATTKTGYECEIDPEILDDWEFLDTAFKIEETDDRTEALKLTRHLVNEMLSAEDAKRLKDHCRSLDDGRLKATRMEQEITDIFESLGELKN